MALAFWWIPLIVIAILAAIVAITIFARRRSGVRRGSPVAHSERLTELPQYRRALDRATWRVVISGILVTALVAMLTMTGARWVYTKVITPEKYNRDIVLCLDVSGSMIDYDAKVIDRYLEMLPGFSGERMSLVLWNSSAVPVFPLTDDYQFVEAQLTEIRDAMLYQGYSDLFLGGTLRAPGASLVGDGLASCVMQFEGAAPSATEEPEDDGRSRSIILATDNVVNGTQTITLPEAAAYATKNFIKIYGLDANEFQDAYAREYRQTLEDVGGSYYELTDGTSVDEIVDTITSDETSRVEGAPQLFVIDRPEVWLWSAFALTGGFMLAARRWRL